MYALTMNTNDGESLSTTFCGVFQTHDEAHAEMVERIECHRDDWVTLYEVSPDVFTVEIKDDTGCLIDGDRFDWNYYEAYFIFDTEDPGQTFVY